MNCAKIIFLLFVQIAVMQIGLSHNAVTVYGKIANPTVKKVFIGSYNNLINYELVYLDSAELNSNGNFSMTFSCDHPIHALFYHGNEYTKLFIVPGDSLQMTLDAKQFDETLHYQGKGEFINNYLANKMRVFSNPDDFNTLYNRSEASFNRRNDSIRKVKQNFIDTYFSNSKNKSSTIRKYVEEEESEILCEWATAKLEYPGIYSYLNHLPYNLETPDSYFDFLKTVIIQDSKSVITEAYVQFIEQYIYDLVDKKIKKDTTLNRFVLKAEMIEQHFSGEVREFLLAKWSYDCFARLNDLDNGKAIYEKYKKLSRSKKYLDLLDKAMVKASRLVVNKPAPDFTLLDMQGKKVSLSDFKGKVVYLDIWSSWCGPCRMEIPYAKKLEEEMRGKDIVFLCVSIDDDEESWKKIIRDKELPGVHLISKGSFDSEICKLYNVNAVPYYNLIDKEGKFAIINADRPSGNIKKDLEALLK